VKKMIGIIWNTNGVGKETYERIYAPHYLRRCVNVKAFQGHRLVNLQRGRGEVTLHFSDNTAVYVRDCS
jgi:hypothetical protein